MMTPRPARRMVFCLATAFAALAVSPSEGAFCTGLSNGFHPDPSTSCQTFYQCNNGAGVSQSCGAGTKFDTSCSCCNFAAQVKCQGGGPSAANAGTPPTTMTPSGPTSSACPSKYLVKSGDTLGTIASSHGTTVTAITAANPSITNPNQISIGQSICLPGGTPTPAISTGSSNGAALYSGSGSGTYYYDVKTPCPQNPNGYPETNGYTACESYTPGPNQKTLKQGNSNNVVAIDMNVLAANRAQLCGKKIIVMHNGSPVSAPDGGDFYVWDGCAACVGGVRIDFSVSGLKDVDPNACNLGVVPGVSWQIVNVQSRPFVA